MRLGSHASAFNLGGACYIGFTCTLRHLMTPEPY
jgi:hypothetical protein